MHRTQAYTVKLSRAVHERLAAFLEQQRLLYNAALEERIGRCGARVKKSLSDRLHVCPDCGLSIDRDWNAALNILSRGLTVSPPTGGTVPCGVIGAENGSACYFAL